VPFVILPLVGDAELVVYRGYEDFTVASLLGLSVDEVVVDLVRRSRT
jgi:hypothetical protein